MPQRARRSEPAVGAPRLTLGQWIGLGFGGLALVLAALFTVFYATSRRTILLATEQLMRQASRRVGERLDGHLAAAERLVAALESQAARGLLTRDRLEPALIAALDGHPDVLDVALTFGDARGVYEVAEPPHEPGELRLAPGGSGQVSAARGPAGAVLVRRVSLLGGRWRAEETWIGRDGTRRPSALDARAARAPDPTIHPTFTTPSRPAFRGHAFWSDLSFFEADAASPEEARRRVVSLQKALWAGDAFRGVVRVTLASDRLDELVRVRVDAADRDRHVVFLTDGFGRLLTRLGPRDRFALLDAAGRPDPDGDVRVVAAGLDPAVAAALATLASGPDGRGPTIHRLAVAGVSYLAGAAPLLDGRTYGWRVGMVVPEAHYLGALAAAGRRGFVAAALLGLAATAGAAALLRAMRRDLGRLIAETTRLRSFDFRPAPAATATLRDVAEASRSLEQAKTALRALGKYVPLDLVRELYDAGREPVLGAAVQDVTLLFADVAGFTAIAEGRAPAELARALGAYLEAMTRAIHATGGLVDKYTGDGVMALWNTPRPRADHPARACEAALACLAATEALFAGPAWTGPPWRTRFGIHRAEVSVGHFGAPDRLSFTAMGDGVNLAARLESLGKQYGVAILVSASVAEAARDRFWFRRLDRVAVQGKQAGVEVHELLGRRRPGEAPPAIVAPYEAALAAYLTGDFTAALTLLDDLGDDPPSRVLAARCRAYRLAPPAAWSGTHVAGAK